MLKVESYTVSRPNEEGMCYMCASPSFQGDTAYEIIEDGLAVEACLCSRHCAERLIEKYGEDL